MSTLLKPLLVREELLNRKLRIFTPIEFGRVFPLESYKIKYFLEEQVKNGLFVRLKQGIYALKTDLPREEEIANVLYKPSYISFEHALAYYGILPEMPYKITSATTKPTRIFDKYAYFTIKREAYTGYSLVNGFLIADREKATVDYFYFQSLGKKGINDRLNLSGLDKRKINFYLKLYDRKALYDYFR